MVILSRVCDNFRFPPLKPPITLHFPSRTAPGTPRIAPVIPRIIKKNMCFLYIFIKKSSTFDINNILTNEIDSGASKIGFSIEIRFSGAYSHVKWSCLAPLCGYMGGVLRAVLRLYGGRLRTYAVSTEGCWAAQPHIRARPFAKIFTHTRPPDRH